MKQVKILLGIVVFGFMQSCGPEPLVNELKECRNETWSLENTLEAEFEVTDTLKPYDFNVLIRNSSQFAYRNIYVFFDYAFPDGTQTTDTVSFYLADALGKWKGSGIGGLYSNQVLFKRNALFPMKGDYSLTLRHGMRDTNLLGISEIGFQIIPSE